MGWNREKESGLPWIMMRREMAKPFVRIFTREEREKKSKLDVR